MIRILMFICALLLPVGASARWHRAETTNFIVYSNGDENDLRKRALALEKFGVVLQTLTGAQRPKIIPVKIKIYFVVSADDVISTMPFPVYGVAGYYSTTMRGPFAVMPRQSIEGPEGKIFKQAGLSADVILRHELTHHFTFQYFPVAYPAWYTEGFADYAGAIQIDDENVVKIGLFLSDRASALRSRDWVPLSKLMNPPREGLGADSFANYSEGWILVHYFNQSNEHKEQLRKYLLAINNGATFGEALKIFGDINVLDRDVRAYAARRSLPASATKFMALDPGPISVTPLTAAEEALVDFDIRLSSGIPASRAPAFASRVRGVASHFAQDPFALELQVEAERLANDTAAANATIERWLAQSPNDPWALYHRGTLDIDTLVSTKSTDEQAWAGARARIVAAMKARPNEPRFLRAYYQSYSRRGVLPPPVAQNALSKALDLIPAADLLRHDVALDYERRGMIQDAIDTIAPIAFGQVDENDKEKRRRRSLEREYRLAGEQDPETPREMLARLEKEREVQVGKSGDD